MKLESQVCSLDLAKRLKELGVKQESLFYFMRAEDKYAKESKYGHLKYGLSGYFGLNTEPYVLGMAGLIGLANCIDSVSAFTVAELGEMLPDLVVCEKGYSEWSVSYWWGNRNKKLKPTECEVYSDTTEANARAKMLVYLLENKLI